MAAKSADVTIAQGAEVRRMANSKGITREQFQVKGLGELLPIALDAIREGGRLKKLPPITPPAWGRIVFVDRVPVQLDQDWNSAINMAAPDTPNHWFIREMSQLYPPVGTGVTEVNLVLVSLNGDHYRNALVWATECELLPASPRHIFALVNHKPGIYRELLKVDYVRVISPVAQMHEGYAHVCSVCLFEGFRKALMHRVESIGDTEICMAFLRE